jgi:hypothetical protein
MLSAMPIVDGLLLSLFVDARWLAVGLALGALTRLGQRYVRGD